MVSYISANVCSWVGTGVEKVFPNRGVEHRENMLQY